MSNTILSKYHFTSRDDALKFLKSLWNEEPQPCPLCKGQLDFLHKKAKKSNCDWVCTACGERYDTMDMLNQFNAAL